MIPNFYSIPFGKKHTLFSSMELCWHGWTTYYDVITKLMLQARTLKSASKWPSRTTEVRRNSSIQTTFTKRPTLKSQKASGSQNLLTYSPSQNTFFSWKQAEKFLDKLITSRFACTDPIINWSPACRSSGADLIIVT